MGLKFGLFLIFTFALLAVFSSNLISSGRSNLMLIEQQGETYFQFWVTFGNVDWGNRSISTDIKVRIKDLPYNYSRIECLVENSLSRYDPERKQTFQVEGGRAQIFLGQGEPRTVGFSYGGGVSVTLRLFGLMEFYPFDVHMVNITFSLPSFGLINQDNSEASVSFIGEAELAWVGRFSSVVWDGELAKLNFTYSFGRGMAQVGSFLVVIGVCYLLLGTTPLISPEKLEHRLTICLTLFIFSISFFGAVSPPVRTYRMTLGEWLIYGLLMGTGLIAVASVVEKALIEVKPRLIVLQYVLDGLFLLMTIGTLQGNFGWFSQALGAYPWQSYPALVSMFSGMTFTMPIAYGYVSKTLIFTVHSLRKNRARISKRIRAIRIFHRKAKSS